MKAYSAFSGIYDRCMDNVPYDKWAAAIVRLLNDAGIAPGSLVCDLGCGTGEMTERLRRAGFDIIGIDAFDAVTKIFPWPETAYISTQTAVIIIKTAILFASGEFFSISPPCTNRD